MGTVKTEPNWVPNTDEDRHLIRLQLERILASSEFRNSKRFPAFLRFVVESYLAGDQDVLKERTIGIHVFGRGPGYDTSTDPIVRITAADIRKRLGQYYHEQASPEELVIGLPSGGYVPEFHHPRSQAAHFEQRSPEPMPVETQLAPVRATLPRIRGRLLWVAGAVSLMFAAAALIFVSSRRGDALEAFWEPITAGNPVVLIVVVPGGPDPNYHGNTVNDAVPSIGDHEHSLAQMMTLSDAMALSELTGILRLKRQKFNVRTSISIDLKDLRAGPSILIGGFNNTWTGRITRDLRFYFYNSPSMWYGIKDRSDPANDSWKVLDSMPYLDIAEDYAIIARVWDPEAEHFSVVAAGVMKYGTIAAGEFLTNSDYMEQLASRAPKGWETRNVEAVISTRVLRGEPGPPRLVAAHFW